MIFRKKITKEDFSNRLLAEIIKERRYGLLKKLGLYNKKSFIEILDKYTGEFKYYNFDYEKDKLLIDALIEHIQKLSAYLIEKLYREATKEQREKILDNILKIKGSSKFQEIIEEFKDFDVEHYPEIELFVKEYGEQSA